MAYQIEGKVKLRCGSPHKIGEPVAVLLPATAQLLLPIVGSGLGNFLMATNSSGRASGTESSFTGLNFHPPALSTTGSVLGSRSGYNKSSVSFPNNFRALVISMS